MITSRRTLLPLVGFALTFPAKGDEKSAQSKIAAYAVKAVDWVASTLVVSGYVADLLRKSLIEIDRFFEDYASAGVPKPGRLIAEVVGSRVFAMGSYIGETLCRTFGGDWIRDDDDPHAEINLALKRADGSTIGPIQQAMKRYRNGGEDGIAAYGAVLAKKR